MSRFEFHGNVEATNMMVGDHNRMEVGRLVDALAEQAAVQPAGEQELAATVAALRAELGRTDARPDRVRHLLATLSTGAGAVGAMAGMVDGLRAVLGLAV